LKLKQFYSKLVLFYHLIYTSDVKVIKVIKLIFSLYFKRSYKICEVFKLSDAIKILTKND